MRLTSLPPPTTVAYSLGIYLLNLFLAFLQPKFDPSLTGDEELEDGGAGGPGGARSPLPVKQDEEFRPFIRRLPEFKFWVSATRAVLIAFGCAFFDVFNVPVFWPVLVVYWIILFTLTSKLWPRPDPVRDLSHGVRWVLRVAEDAEPGSADIFARIVRRQIQHMIKYRYVPFSFGKKSYNARAGH